MPSLTKPFGKEIRHIIHWLSFPQSIADIREIVFYGAREAVESQNYGAFL